MTVALLRIALAATDPIAAAEFWRNLLSWSTDEDGTVLRSPDPRDFQLWFRQTHATKDTQNPRHLHLTSETLDHQRLTVARAVDLGAKHIDVGQQPEEGHVVLADPEGNEFCVVEPGNRWLAGCGSLAELACDGSREVGLFWSAALGWPLVWDQDGETAVRLPEAGPKIAWGGLPLMPRSGETRIRFVVTPGDDSSMGDEVDHLLALGARMVDSLPNEGLVLADPDGDEFILLPRG